MDDGNERLLNVEFETDPTRLQDKYGSEPVVVLEKHKEALSGGAGSRGASVEARVRLLETEALLCFLKDEQAKRDEQNYQKWRDLVDRAEYLKFQETGPGL